MACFRGAMELLYIPLPIWAKRKPSGRKPSIAIAKAYEADNPTPKLGGGTLRPRKPDATPERIAALKAQSTTCDPALFAHLFPESASALG
jgi:hypothetical protein